jgi:large subunit ribosomal protein L17
MASSLILHKRIKTTIAKAKALRKYVEPILTKAKVDVTHSRRQVFAQLHNNKEVVGELFNVVARKIATRPGGYTRIIKLGTRQGDAAEMCYIELVDFNELILEQAQSKPKTRRSRRRKGSANTEQNANKETQSQDENAEAKSEGNEETDNNKEA